jgi:fused signal recognition particle receptor
MVDFLKKWREGLKRTRNRTFGQIANIIGTSEITKSTWESLEDLFIQSDIGIETTEEILIELKNEINKSGVSKYSDFGNVLRKVLIGHLSPPALPDFSPYHPAVIMMVGVNGSGKTTTAAKLAERYKKEGLKVLLAAADTYRAAAVDQLQVWADRLNIPLITGQPNSDPGAVAFDAVSSAITRNFDLVIIDTAGRLHTRFNLMEELKKVHRVVGKALADAPHAVWLVLDATTGQNALQQARAFKDAVNVTGVIFAKLDSSAHGGMAFSIQKELQLPILFSGLGEQAEDLIPFDREYFVDSILIDL